MNIKLYTQAQYLALTAMWAYRKCKTCLERDSEYHLQQWIGMLLDNKLAYWGAHDNVH